MRGFLVDQPNIKGREKKETRFERKLAQTTKGATKKRREPHQERGSTLPGKGKRGSGKEDGVGATPGKRAIRQGELPGEVYQRKRRGVWQGIEVLPSG